MESYASIDIYVYLHSFLYACMHTYHAMGVEVWGELVRVDSLLLPCGSQGSNSGPQDWVHSPSSPESSHRVSLWPRLVLNSQSSCLILHRNFLILLDLQACASMPSLRINIFIHNYFSLKGYLSLFLSSLMSSTEYFLTGLIDAWLYSIWSFVREVIRWFCFGFLLLALQLLQNKIFSES